jgi:hypothetical protein
MLRHAMAFDHRHPPGSPLHHVQEGFAQVVCNQLCAKGSVLHHRQHCHLYRIQGKLRCFMLSTSFQFCTSNQERQVVD